MSHKYFNTRKMHLNLDENICRLCLRNIGCTNIFNEENIAINIMKCSRIKAESDDGLPHLICRECTDKLNVSIQFRDQCEKSDRQLRQQLGKCYDHDAVFDIHDSFLNNADYTTPEKKVVEYVGVITFARNSDRTTCIVTKNNGESKIDKPQNHQSSPIKKKLKDSTHTSKKYQCDACGRIFNKCSHFTVHSRIHTGEKPFKCSECDKSFIASHHLLAHRRVHKNERPYQCTHCGKCFSEVSSLSRHTKVHTGDKKYTCPRCPKRFITQFDARRHVFKHTGETPFQCQICFLSYTEASSLSKHNKTHKKESESQPSVIRINLEET